VSVVPAVGFRCGRGGLSASQEAVAMAYKDPNQQRAYKREWARMRRAGERGTPGGTQLPLEFRLRTAQDILALLEEQVKAVRGDSEAGTLEKARTIGYLAGIALKAVETADLAARLEALEAVLKGRDGP
jgi:hypothetical protein